MKILFRRSSTPLVVKSDNGSCFTGSAFRVLLARHGVVHLRSPRSWPQYNGACEAGIGLLRALTDSAAATRGESDAWTIDDLEEARARANDLLRRVDLSRSSARRLWKARHPVGGQARRLFRETLSGQKPEIREQARHRRKAIERALVEQGYLEVRRGWVRARSTGRGITPSHR